MENFLILGMLISASDIQEAGKEALRRAKSRGAFRPKLGKKSFFPSLNKVELVPIKNLSTGEMDCVQFPKVAF
jgi:hypothetical protein